MVWNSNLKSITGCMKVENATVVNKFDKSERTIPVSGVFIAVGITPRSEFARNHVAMDEKGYIIADETGATSVPGVFAAGDVRTKQLRQVVTAVADGANAVTSAEKYLLTL
jgi:thioredoxin reductase (NADPH)